MKKMTTVVLSICVGVMASAQSWVAPITPEEVVVTSIRVDSINIAIQTNMTARGMIGIAKMDGTNLISRAGVPLTNGDITNLLGTVGLTLPQLGRVMLQTGGATNAMVIGGVTNAPFIRQFSVYINSFNNKATVMLTLQGTNRPVVINEATINEALAPIGGVTAFRTLFVDFSRASISH